MRPGPRNLITDIAGLAVGNAEDHRLKSGATVLVGARPFTASVHVMGGAPGTRETDLLAPDKMVAEVDALVLSGGSAFGLDAATGVADRLRAMGRGFRVGDAIVPIVPGAILFDLINGGQKDWADNPYRALGIAALDAADADFAIGTAGAGTGATTAGLKGGLGSASLVLPGGITVGALVAANPTGQVTVGDGAHFWAAPFEIDAEFGGRGPCPDAVGAPDMRTKHDLMSPAANTTIAIVATDARLDKAQAHRMAVAAHDGMGRAIVPAHTPVDGDLVFALATGEKNLGDPVRDMLEIGHAAAVCLSRAIARAVYEARPSPGDLFPTWNDRFG
ncbi:MAG TPA: P1 family peptidase [Devosiaceae bacterium]